MGMMLTCALVASLAAGGPALANDTPFLGERMIVAFSFCPKGWAVMNGQLLPINQNQGLFALLGTNYGGNGQTNFALPTATPIVTASGLPLTQCIALEGLFPSSQSGGSDSFVGQRMVSAFSFCPNTYAAMNGQVLTIAQNTALFALIGTAYGGDGQTTFALPAAKPIVTATGAALIQCIALQGIFPPRN